MSVPQINPMLRLQGLACSLSVQLDELLRPDGEAADITELRASGVSERRILALYPFRYDSYAAEIEALLNRQGSWFVRALTSLHLITRSLVLPDDIQRELERRASRTIWLGGLSFSSSLIFAESAREELVYVSAFVHIICELDPGPGPLPKANVTSSFPKVKQHLWWKYAEEDFARISSLLALTRFMLSNPEQISGGLYALHDPLRLLGHESK